MNEVVTKNRKLNVQKLISYGFIELNDGYIFSVDIMKSHMNKKHWYTILLNDSVSTEEICERIDVSYLLAKR